MIKKSSVTTIMSTIDDRKTIAKSSECKVCGASARYSYYGAVVCQSCKMFFKRNAETKETILICHYTNQCSIDINNRHTCAYCRLKKCYKVGMSNRMIRSSHARKNKITDEENRPIDSESKTLVIQHHRNQHEQIPTLNLLRSDQSTLNIEQWNLLTNLVHCYDEYGGYSFGQRYILQQNQLPLKLRYKYSSVLDFVTTVTASTQFTLEKNRDLQSLSLHDRSTLLRTTAEYTSTVGAMFTLRQHRLLNYESFYNSIGMIFRPTAAAFAGRLMIQLDQDDTFIKLILAILSFSTTNVTVYTNSDPNYLMNVKAILSIQDMYIELAWRYISYKNGHNQAVGCFLNLIRCLFYVNSAIAEAHETKQLTEMIDTVIEQTEQTFLF